jgi:cation transport regulator
MMPYRTNADLPLPVRSHLPPHAQDTYREAFNHAFASYAGDARQEEIAHRTAWAAVKRSYVKGSRPMDAAARGKTVVRSSRLLDLPQTLDPHQYRAMWSS